MLLVLVPLEMLRISVAVPVPMLVLVPAFDGVAVVGKYGSRLGSWNWCASVIAQVTF